MASKANQHILDYLSYYLGLPHEPHFAVLLDGPWGIGKTFLLDEFLKEKFGRTDKKFVKVSLYGLSTIAEIDDALFHAIFPILTGTSAKIVGRVVKAGLKYFTQMDSGDFKLRDLPGLEKFNPEVYVFDDLERCDADLNKVLGYINQFVEHSGAKVIIVANQNEIKGNDDYARRREKLIGKTLQVRSSFDEAFSFFASKIDDKDAKEVIRREAAEITSIYEQSSLDNLRILQQAMWDFERFYKSLSAKHRQNADAIRTVLRILFALSFELKADRVSNDDLMSGRGLSAMVIARMNEKSQKTPMMLAEERYPQAEINDETLGNEIVADYLVRGVLDEAKVAASLDASRFFVSVADEPSWRTVWHWNERSDEECLAAAKRLEQEYAQRQYKQFGEVLHVLGIRLFLGKIGVLPMTQEEIVADGKTYIDDLYSARVLGGLNPEEATGLRFRASGGLGFSEGDTPEFRELARYLESKIRQSVEDDYPTKGRELLDLMKNDATAFLRLVCLTAHSESLYYRTPILAFIDPEEFVDGLMNLSPSEQHTAMMIFKTRYEHGGLQGELKTEMPWVKRVKELLIERIAKANPISRHRLNSYMDWYLKELALEAEPTNSGGAS